jgi:hypothetical protein
LAWAVDPKPGPRQRSESDTSPDRKVLAQRLAREVIGCDPSILSLLVVDTKQGRLLATANSNNLPKGEQVAPGVLEKLGTVAYLIWGAAGNATELTGGREFIIGAFKNQLILLVNLVGYEMFLVLRLIRSSNAAYVHTKIAALLDVSGQSTAEVG